MSTLHVARAFASSCTMRKVWFVITSAVATGSCAVANPVDASAAQLLISVSVVPNTIAAGSIGDSVLIRVKAENRAASALHIDLGAVDPYAGPGVRSEGTSFGFNLYRIESRSVTLVTGAVARPSSRYFDIGARSSRTSDFVIRLSGDAAFALAPGRYQVHPFFNSNESTDRATFDVVP